MIFAFKSRIFALKSQNTQKFKDFAAKCQTRDMLHRKALTNASFSLIFITHREKSQKDFHRAFAPYSRDWNRQFQTQRIGTQTLTPLRGVGRCRLFVRIGFAEPQSASKRITEPTPFLHLKAFRKAQKIMATARGKMELRFQEMENL